MLILAVQTMSQLNRCGLHNAVKGIRDEPDLDPRMLCRLIKTYVGWGRFNVNFEDGEVVNG